MTTTDSSPALRGEAQAGEAKPAVDLTPNVAQWLVYIRQCDEQIRQLEEAKKQARSHIEAALGDAEVGLVDGQPAVRWTFVHSTRVDLRKLRDQAPDLVEQCTVPTVTRRFTLAGDR